MHMHNFTLSTDYKPLVIYLKVYHYPQLHGYSDGPRSWQVISMRYSLSPHRSMQMLIDFTSSNSQQYKWYLWVMITLSYIIQYFQNWLFASNWSASMPSYRKGHHIKWHISKLPWKENIQDVVWNFKRGVSNGRMSIKQRSGSTAPRC